jgi:hypothetical protein
VISTPAKKKVGLRSWQEGEEREGRTLDADSGKLRNPVLEPFPTQRLGRSQVDRLSILTRLQHPDDGQLEDGRFSRAGG